MGRKHPLGLEAGPYPHASYTDKALLALKFFLFLFQNSSEASDEELNDDLLQSDEEDVDMGYSIHMYH